jgi:hypothetical protein
LHPTPRVGRKFKHQRATRHHCIEVKRPTAGLTQTDRAKDPTAHIAQADPTHILVANWRENSYASQTNFDP